MRPSIAPVVNQKKLPEPIIELHKQYKGPKKQAMDLVHELSHQATFRLWNKIAQEMSPFLPMTGDDALGYLSTFISDLTSNFILLMMDEIANKDQAGRTTEEITHYIVTAIKKTLKLS